MLLVIYDFFVYIKVLNNRNITSLRYEDLNLKKCKFKFNALKQIVIFGLPSFTKIDVIP